MFAKQGIVRHFNRSLFLSCLLIAVSTFNYGFDNQAFATTQAMTPFVQQFGQYNAATKTYAIPAYYLSLLNSLNYIGFGAGVIIGSLISSRFGRRWCMFSMSCWAIVSATITVTASNKEHILAARILNYVYVGMELSVVPVYQSEIVPASVRGLIVGTYQFSLIFGGLIINSICRGTSQLDDNRAWRIPYGLFFIIPSIIISLIWFIPESPRWLLSKGREEQARASLQKLRVGTLTDEEIDREFAATKLTLELEVEKGRFKELWQGLNLKRLLVAIGVSFFQQATGQAFVSQYGAIFIKAVGTVNPFDMTIVNSAISMVGMIVSLYLVDKIGRKPLLLTGAVVQVAALFTMGALGTIVNPSFTVKSAIVAMVTVFAFGFALGWGPLTFVVTTELPALRLRDQSQRVVALVNVIMNFTVSFTIPYLLNAPYANLGSKVGFIFGSIAFLAFVFTWWFVPECKGRSLEQIEMMFQQRVPLRKFRTFKAEEHVERAIEENGDLGEKQAQILMVEKAG